MNKTIKITVIAVLQLFFVISISLFVFPGQIYGENLEPEASDVKLINKAYSIGIDKATIEKGYTVTAFEDDLKLSLVPGILSEATRVDVIQLNEDLPMPWKLDRISQVYQFEFRNKQAYDDHMPFYIQFNYQEQTVNHKQVYFFDKNYNSWRPLPTRDFPKEQFVRSLIHLPFARIAVFSNPNVLSIGTASWYKYKNGLFAASPDFPKGSKIRVYAINSDKFVDVVINDFGPDRSLHPERVIDLDKQAFAQLAPLGAGVIEIHIEPLNIKPDIKNRILGISSAGVSEVPKVSLKTAVITNEQTGEIIWSKNATSVLPLASLTKLVALKVFMETKPDLEKTETYEIKDEEYNYQFVLEWESARLNIKAGETLLIKDLIYSSIVGSTNNTIETLVRVSGVDRDEFIVRMNEIVQDWGASSTSFIEPTGLAPENVSSALDYAIITKAVYADKFIEEVSVLTEYTFDTINTAKTHKIKNTNRLLHTKKYNITGSKTGYLDEAGYCLMTRVKAPNNDSIIVVTLGAEDRDISFYETEELISYAIRKSSQ